MGTSSKERYQLYKDHCKYREHVSLVKSKFYGTRLKC